MTWKIPKSLIFEVYRRVEDSIEVLVGEMGVFFSERLVEVLERSRFLFLLLFEIVVSEDSRLDVGEMVRAILPDDEPGLAGMLSGLGEPDVLALVQGMGAMGDSVQDDDLSVSVIVEETRWKSRGANVLDGRVEDLDVEGSVGVGG